jgi:hypothetical protein
MTNDQAMMAALMVLPIVIHAVAQVRLAWRAVA